MPIAAIIELLERAPTELAELTAGRPAARLHQPPAPDEWSLNEILAHLRSCADVWGACIARILAEDHPTVRAVDPRSWTDQSGYRDLDFATSLFAFTTQRDELLKALRTLTPTQWERAATVTGAGRPLERTVRFYAGWLARHERSHLKHIRRMRQANRA